MGSLQFTDSFPLFERATLYIPLPTFKKTGFFSCDMTTAALVATHNLVAARAALRAAAGQLHAAGGNDETLHDLLDAAGADLERLWEIAASARCHQDELVALLESGQASIIQLSTVCLCSKAPVHDVLARSPQTNARVITERSPLPTQFAGCCSYFPGAKSFSAPASSWSSICTDSCKWRRCSGQRRRPICNVCCC